MIIFPAIDLREGVCVRLQQGDPKRQTVYAKDPVKIAKHWESEGAEWLHIVDLDGAFSKSPKNREVIYTIVRSVSIPVQVGGGIRTFETVQAYLDEGIERIILGTAAWQQPNLVELACVRYPGRIAVGIDARKGKIAVEGWQQTTSVDVLDLASRFDSLELGAIIYTDIHRDGMQSGVNIKATRRLLENVRTPVIASGGVASLDDIRALLPLVPLGLQGVITGKALYSGTVKLKEAIECARHAAGF